MHTNLHLKRGKSKGFCPSLYFTVRQVFIQYFIDLTNRYWIPTPGLGKCTRGEIQPWGKLGFSCSDTSLSLRWERTNANTDWKTMTWTQGQEERFPEGFSEVVTMDRALERLGGTNFRSKKYIVSPAEWGRAQGPIPIDFLSSIIYHQWLFSFANAMPTYNSYLSLDAWGLDSQVSKYLK